MFSSEPMVLSGIESTLLVGFATASTATVLDTARRDVATTNERSPGRVPSLSKTDGREGKPSCPLSRRSVGGPISIATEMVWERMPTDQPSESQGYGLTHGQQEANCCPADGTATSHKKFRILRHIKQCSITRQHDETEGSRG